MKRSFPRGGPFFFVRCLQGLHSRRMRGRKAPAFSLVELLVTLGIIALLATLAMAMVSGIMQRGDRADALAKTRTMGVAVLNYAADHGGLFPPLFPGQVLEYEAGRGGRIVTECAGYLDLATNGDNFFAAQFLPRAYARAAQPADRTQMRVWVMNSSITNGNVVIKPFGRVAADGETPVENLPVASVPQFPGLWMMSSADQMQPQVAGAPWKANAPAAPPLGDYRAVFGFDGSASLMHTNSP